MESKKILYKMLHLALVDFRAEAASSKNNRLYSLSNLLHNLPLELLKAEESDFDKILKGLEDSAANNKGLREWIERQKTERVT